MADVEDIRKADNADGNCEVIFADINVVSIPLGQSIFPFNALLHQACVR